MGAILIQKGESVHTVGRLSRAPALALAWTLSCGAESPRACSADADCPSDAYCHEGACRASAPPTAVIAAPGAPATFQPVVFDGSGSSDPDPRDAVVAYAWSISTVSAACPPVPPGGRDPRLQAVFPCPGDFDVQLVVTDGFGLASAPVSLRISVAASADPPQVAMGPDLALDHLCSGSPLLCAPTDAAGARAFQLSAAGASSAPGEIGYRWSWRAPPGADPAARVAFGPDDRSAAPSVSIETDGTAIAGTWEFDVWATDARGLVALGTQKVTVGNRPPVISGAASPTITVPHVFDAASSRFVAQGRTPSVTWADPDGDPVVAVDFAASAAGTGPGSFSLTPYADHAVFDVSVPFAAPADGAYLIGPAVSRAIEVSAVDVNGGAGSAAWTVVVSNRPPRVATAVPALTVGHTFDAASSRYLASATLSSFADDDGDPLALDADTGDPTCSGLSLAGGAARVECALAYAGTPAVDQFARPHWVSPVARDPWSSASTGTTLAIENRLPRLTASSAMVSPACYRAASPCCDFDPVLRRCIDVPVGQHAAAIGVAPPVVDDDGDPIALEYRSSGTCATFPASQTCLSGSCPAVAVTLCAMPAVCGGTTFSDSVATTFRDGTGPIAGSFFVQGSCP